MLFRGECRNYLVSILSLLAGLGVSMIGLWLFPIEEDIADFIFPFLVFGLSIPAYKLIQFILDKVVGKDPTS
jgi:hypothetical protein